MSSRAKIRLLVAAQAMAAVLAGLLFLVPAFWTNVIGWALAAVLVSGFFAWKNQVVIAQGSRAAHYIGLDRASVALLASGMGMAFLHAFFIATELAK